MLLVGVAIDAFAGDVERALSQDLSECGRIVRRMADSSRSGTPTAADIALLKKSAEAIQADRLLLTERHATLVERAATLGGKASGRQDAVSSALLKNLDDLLSRLDAIGSNVTPSDLDALKQLLDTLVPHKSRPLLGALPYKHINYPPREPASAPVVRPAYKGGDRNVSAADTATTPEAPISKAIVDLAQSLQWNPVLIYEWVKNNVETEWYWGSMKGAEETLRQKSGNDADQAALLVALLRASNFPARYIKGTIEFFPDLDKAKNLTGLDDPAKIYTFLQKAGIPVKPVIAGGGISNFQIEHIWVEAFIPYSNYRGAVVDDQGKIWLGLDTSIKPQGYTRTKGAGVPADMLSTLRDDYLKAVQTLSPVDYLKGKLNDSLATTQPPKTWSDLKDSATIIPDVLKIIPSSLQFPQIAITGEYQTLPDELKHKVVFTATAGGNELFSLTLETLRLSNSKIALRAEPETVEDQNTIDSFGGLDNTPPYLVRLRPVLTVDGERMIVAQDGLPMGGDYTLNIDIITPNGTERITSSQIAGNLSVIGVVAQKAATPAAIADTDDAEAILHKEAIGYIDRWNSSEDDLAGLLGQSVSRPTVSIATVGAQLEVTQLMDTPHDMQWKGLFLDAGYRRIESVGRNGNERDFMRLSALQGSILENRIFEDDLKVNSVSTAKLLQLAVTNGTTSVSIDKTTIDTILPQLTFDNAVKQDITDAVNQNLTVTIPQNEVAYQNWTGIGYIKEDPATGESGWMLSGNVAGGMTAWSGEQWDSSTLQTLYDTLRNTSGVKPNTNTLEAVYIFKIPASDQQTGVVGKALGKQLQVKVLDNKMQPVSGASVTFSVKAGGGTLSSKGAPASTSFVATTDSSGIAKITLILGLKTTDNPIYWTTSGNSYSDQYGDNVVEVLLNNNNTTTNFNAYGAPGALTKLRPTYGMTLQGYFLSYAGFVAVMAEDSYGNPIANQKVTFQLGSTTVNGVCKGKAYDTTPALLIKDGDVCINSSPTIKDAKASCKGAAATINSVTSATGIWAGVVLGGAPGATYPITAAAVSSGKSFTAQFSPTSYDFTNCNVDAPPKAELYMSSLMAADIYGNIINAGRSGTDISIMAKEYLITEGQKTAPETLSCSDSTLSCSKIVGDHTYTTTTNFYGDGAIALFNTVPVKNLGNGLFQGIYTLKPGLNTVKIEGAASYVINSMNNNCSGGCATTPTTTVSTLNAVPTYIQVYGVDITIKQPLNIMLNDQGVSRNNLKVSYTINPTSYHAANALILLYKVTDQNGKKYYEQIDYIPVENKGSGYGVIARGYRFDETLSYAASVVLNYGSYVQIMSDPAPIIFAKGALIPDYNHNRKIDDEDLDRALNNDPYYFWVNDDDGKGDTKGSGIPGSGNLSWNRTNVDGTRDLIDFFPVYMDIAKMKTSYPPGVYTYKLHHETSSLTVVETELDSTATGNYLTEMTTTQKLANAAKTMITNNGYTLPDRVLSGKGVILLEGWKEATSPLKLAVFDAAGVKMCEIALNLSIAGVEQMFRHKNLTREMYWAYLSPNQNNQWTGVNPVAGHPIPVDAFNGSEPDRLTNNDFSNPTHFSGFDADNEDKDFIHVHGFNVNGQDARGEQSEVFKRLYWSGSRARFWGVTWYGWDSQFDLVPQIQSFVSGRKRSPNYHVNVRHAFNAGKLFKLFVASQNLGNATISAHSLGNMVVSTAIQENMPYGKYLMINAAVAEEAYISLDQYENNWDKSTRALMYSPDWRYPGGSDTRYEPYLWQSEWYKLFNNPDDERYRLTWRNNFSSVRNSNVYTYYATTDEAFRPFKLSLEEVAVAASPDYDGANSKGSYMWTLIQNFMKLSDPEQVGTYAFSFNELMKGTETNPYFLTSDSKYCGWGFNKDNGYYNICSEPVPVGSEPPPFCGLMQPADANMLAKNVLKTMPFFNKNPDNAALFSDNLVPSSVLTTAMRERMLANEIPALTFAVGHMGVVNSPQINNINIRNDFIPDNSPWPRDEKEWRHSDFINVGYPYLWRFYDDWASKSKGVSQ
jgi:hypothetical protein